MFWLSSKSQCENLCVEPEQYAIISRSGIFEWWRLCLIVYVSELPMDLLLKQETSQRDGWVKQNPRCTADCGGWGTISFPSGSRVHAVPSWGVSSIPHGVSSLECRSRRIYPPSPQRGPQEFRISQKSTPVSWSVPNPSRTNKGASKTPCL